jgi:hypothetical protein
MAAVHDKHRGREVTVTICNFNIRQEKVITPSWRPDLVEGVVENDWTTGATEDRGREFEKLERRLQERRSTDKAARKTARVRGKEE